MIPVLQSLSASLLFLSLSLLYGFPESQVRALISLIIILLPSYLRLGLSEVGPNIDLRLLKKFSVWDGW